LARQSTDFPEGIFVFPTYHAILCMLSTSIERDRNRKVFFLFEIPTVTRFCCCHTNKFYFRQTYRAIVYPSLDTCFISNYP